LKRARGLLAHPTYSEQLLWSALRGGRLGVVFRRQQVIGQFMVDFLAKKARLIVEIDGDVYHAARVQADAAREQKLVRAGYTVLRIQASVVERDLARAVWMVREAVEAPF
jgi:very-short-patch-repair endonuclease